MSRDPLTHRDKVKELLTEAVAFVAFAGFIAFILLAWVCAG